MSNKIGAAEIREALSGAMRTKVVKISSGRYYSVVHLHPYVDTGLRDMIQSRMVSELNLAGLQVDVVRPTEIFVARTLKEGP